MMKTRFHTREFHGPEPGSVGILERLGNSGMNAAAERQARDNEMARRLNLVQDQKLIELRNQWENNSNEKLKQNRIRRRFEVHFICYFINFLIHCYL